MAERDERAVGRQILHPNSRRFHSRKLGWVFAEHGFGHNRFLTQDAVLAHREAGNGSHFLADPGSVDSGTDGFDDARSFVSDAGRQLRRFGIKAPHEQIFGSIQAHRLHA